ncbi:MAG: hypothetical protein M5U18_14610 [Dehalococcoidia bacterium]|nr:hypothetical protein [Dehalococcoidia bacterium]
MTAVAVRGWRIAVVAGEGKDRAPARDGDDCHDAGPDGAETEPS